MNKYNLIFMFRLLPYFKNCAACIHFYIKNISIFQLYANKKMFLNSL